MEKLSNNVGVCKDDHIWSIVGLQKFNGKTFEISHHA